MNAHYQPRRRNSLRLKGYDYSDAGAYFITICTHERIHAFGTVVNGAMRLNDAGRVVAACWCDIPRHFRNVILDAWVVMPNHLHGIIVISRDAAAPGGGADGVTVGATQASPVQAGPPDSLPGSEFAAAGPPDSLPGSAAAGPPDSPPGSAAAGPPDSLPPLPRSCGPRRGSIGAIVGSFKSAASKRINEMRGTPGAPVWQRGYYDSIVREGAGMHRIRKYIMNNPARWSADRNNPAARGREAAS